MATLSLAVDPRQMQTGAQVAEGALAGVKQEAREAQSALDRMWQDAAGRWRNQAGQLVSATDRVRFGLKNTGEEAARFRQRTDEVAAAGRSFDIRGVSMQLSQVAQQASATGDPLRALAIQLPDIGLAFGTIGIAAGVAAGALLPLLGGLGRTADAADDIVDAFDAAKSATDAAREAQNRYDQAVVLAGRNRGVVTQEVLGHLRAEALALEALARLEDVRLERSRRALEESIAAKREELDRLVADALAPIAGDSNDPFTRSQAEDARARTTREILDNNRDLVEELREQKAELDLVNAQLGLGKGETTKIIDDLIKGQSETRTLADLFGDASGEAETFAGWIEKAFGHASAMAALEMSWLDKAAAWMRGFGAGLPSLGVDMRTLDQPRSQFDRDGVSRDAIRALAALEQMAGRAFTINSAHRSAAENEAAGGARSSQHIQGNAFDINALGMSIAERVALIQQARAAGFGGVGVYANALHFDTGPTRAWGPDYSSGSIPAWAVEAVQARRGMVPGMAQSPGANTTRPMPRGQGGVIDLRAEAEDMARATDEQARATERARSAYDAWRGSTDALVRVTLEHEEALRTISEAQAAGVITAEEAAAAQRRAVAEYEKAIEQLARSRQMWDDLANVGGSAIDKLIAGTSSLKDVLRDTLKELVAMITKRNILSSGIGSASDSLGTLIFKSIFAGFFDTGGTIMPGQYGVVGEYGPELVGATAGGAVVTSRTDTARMMQPSPSMNVNIDARGAQKGVGEEIAAAIQRAAPQIIGQSVGVVKQNFGAYAQQYQQDGRVS